MPQLAQSTSMSAESRHTEQHGSEPRGGPGHGVLVTIDGTAGTGKSTVAKLLAQRLGFDFLDTGAMYRACALISITHGIPLSEPARLVRVVEESNPHFDWSLSTPAICIFGNPVEGLIRTKPVTAMVRHIALIPELRTLMVRLQRKIAYQRPWLVTEGRDQGTRVFPNALVKFFLDADLRLRAERRKWQVKDLADTSVEEIMRELHDRDESDRSDLGGLRVPEDGVLLANNSPDPLVIVSEMAGIVQARMTAAGIAPSPMK